MTGPTTSSTLTRIGQVFRAGAFSYRSRDARQFLQERLALFSTAGCVICVGLIIITNGIWYMLDGGDLREYVLRPGNLTLYASSAVLSAMVIATRRRRILASRTLLTIDTVGTVLVCAGLNVHTIVEDATLGGPMVAVLACTNALLLRAVVVPSDARRTLGIGLLALVPILVPSMVRPALVSAFLEDASDLLKITMLAVWALIAVVVATLTSNVIYGLRKKVSEARQLGQYRLEKKIGVGGMGEVYRASHALLRRPTAIKLLRPDETGHENVARFEREVQATSRLTHPNTVAIYDYGRTPDGIFYYAMELLDGIDLEQLTRYEGCLPPGRAIHILRQMCGSLDEAHSMGLVHRDIKPANAILCRRGGRHDVVKVLDFGLVKNVATGEGEGEGDRVIAGTPRYLAPESIANPDQIDSRSDIYAVGAVAYFMLTGKPVFDADSALEICSMQINDTPRPLSERRGKPLALDLESLVLQCLEKNPARRPSSAATLDEALGACEDAGSWTESDACAWWTHHAARLAGAGDGTEDPEGTIRVDMDERASSEWKALDAEMAPRP